MVIIYMCIVTYSKTSNRPSPQTNHSPISIALFGSQPIHCEHILTPKPTTSLNGSFKLDPHVGRFKEALLYKKCVPHIYM